jgi:two-component system sensor histidine kinase HydH
MSTPHEQQYAELAELAGGFIHEIKNHLSTLGLNLQLLSEDFAEPQNPRERRALARVQRIQGECERLVDVSNNFLRFARMQELKTRSIALNEVIEELIDFFGPTAQQGAIEVRSFVPSDLPRLNVDVDLLRQALLNLMLNAQQAMPKGGQLTIQATHEAAPLPGSILLTMIDTGTGMTPEVQDKIFRPFFSTKPGGTGLGLATARKIIRAHGGAIEAQSEPGRGTKFSIRLPC